MTLQEVKNKANAKEFIQFPVRLYSKERNWIRPLDKDIAFVFDRSKNKYFQNGDAVRWLLKDNNKQTIGRIAAFYHQKTSDQSEQPTGGIGFFECINNQDAANMMFDAAKDWLKEKGFEAMDGPVNFGDRNEWWGLLTEGFYEPNYSMPYNFSYYQNLFDNYGFKPYFKQYTFHRSIAKTNNLPPEIIKKAERLSKDPNYVFKHIKKHNLLNHAEEFREIYNQAWSKFKGVGEMSKQQTHAILKKLKPIADERLIWIGYYNNQPIAIFIMIPEMNQLFKHLNGKFNAWSKLKLLFYKTFHKQTKALGLIFGIIPDFQGKGVEGALISAFVKASQKSSFPYTEMEMNWIGDFNPKMIRVVKKIGAEVKKVHITYRYLFDPSKPFKRAPMLD
ncbi:MAG: hypothetical protein ACQESZ_08215 [Bacteroidota bacterium]